MATTEEGSYTLKDGTKLYTKTWKPKDDEKVATMVFCHGFSDHCNTYPVFFDTLASRGIEVFSYDQRGWGKSVTTSSSKGLTGPTSLTLADLSEVLSSRIPSPVPLFLGGHSMGGGIVLTYAALGPAEIRKHIVGYILDAPLLELHPSTQPWKITSALLRVVGKMLPRAQMLQKLDPKIVSRDPEVQKAFKDDKLCHDTGTLEGLAAMLDRGKDLISGKVKVGDEARVWIGHGTGDKITWWEASKKWIESFPGRDKTLKLYEGWAHKLQSEPGEDKVTFSNDVADWILAHLEGPSSTTSAAPPTSAATAAATPEAAPTATTEEDGSKSKL